MSFSSVRKSVSPPPDCPSFDKQHLPGQQLTSPGEPIPVLSTSPSLLLQSLHLKVGCISQTQFLVTVWFGFKTLHSLLFLRVSSLTAVIESLKTSCFQREKTKSFHCGSHSTDNGVLDEIHLFETVRDRWNISYPLTCRSLQQAATINATRLGTGRQSGTLLNQATGAIM